MARKCSGCGETGHTARNCPLTEEERRLAKLPPPTCLHISINGDRMCKATEDEEWPPKWLEDELARTLPICETCATLYRETFGREINWPPSFEETQSNSTTEPEQSS